MKRISVVIVLLLAGVTGIHAQSFEDFIGANDAAFEEFTKKSDNEFESFRKRINTAFADYMRAHWVWQEANIVVANPEDEVPDVVPAVIPDLGEYVIPEDNQLAFEEIVPVPFDDPEPISVAPIEYKPQPAEQDIEFMFYGTPCSVRFDLGKKAMLKGCREDSVADMWEQLCTDDYNNILYDTQELRKSLNLCDWAYLKLTESVAGEVYGPGTNEAVVLSAFLMNQSGFRIRMGRSGEDRIHLLIATADDIYDRLYWKMDNTRYYMTENVEISGMYVFETAFPNEQALRLSIDKEPHFISKMTPDRTLKPKRTKELSVTSSINENLLSFYDGYPASHIRNNKYSQWYHYANAPVGDDVKERIYPGLKEAIDGKTQAQAANIIIDFVQTAFEYKTDDEVWGRERTFFPEETLYYPYCDCEDRAILFSRLVRDLMGLDVVLVYYPGHLATAVSFTEDVSGDHLVIKDRKYVICDPTYIGATIGMTMPGLEGADVRILSLS